MKETINEKLRKISQAAELMNEEESGSLGKILDRLLEKREVALFRGMVESLALIYDWCMEKGKHEFQRREIEHLLVGGSHKARFGDWVLFGGLVYKDEKGHFGLNMDRTEEFLFGTRIIPIRLWKDPLTGRITPIAWGNRHDIPGIQEFLDEKGIFRAKYTMGPISLFDKKLEIKR
ncbi:MAG: hypothetical protein PHN89_00465 [Candidatus Pacebacteria bacterium]|nr:hypothetical protein [Candidatus Paceibacterota bacterium]